ncbi:WD repeat-containing protein 61 [Galdieria sulphuraria]|uniref:WD repeat-containing protein 61 n=1 Tax=Galdieria sulphuraria TaxID=130081 RepID=M2WUZ5_GALSU|nr:WD repeat-containing protein 61 [Galdieria sulphuraria]EME27785.1 WD repeat-containing protein 61 [Galdieria sulphuraria]|eukprot:XP_005704305.1 WD repeat-containing protein 61 [Galdieria sulphuraria]
MQRFRPLGSQPTLQAHERGIWCLSHRDEQNCTPPLLATGDEEGLIKLWKPPLQEETDRDAVVEEWKTLQGHSFAIISVAFQPKGDLLASSSLDGTIRLWQSSSGHLQRTIDVNIAEAWDLAFDPQGKVIVSGGHSGVVSIWDVETGSLQKSLETESNNKFIFAVAFSPDGKWLVCSTSDGTIQVFDWMTQSRLKTLKGQKLFVRSLCFSPTAPYLLFAACDDKLIHIYDVEHGEMVASLRGHQEGVNVVDVSSNHGHFMASGSVDRSVKIWDCRQRESIYFHDLHKEQVWGVEFCVESSRLISVGDDGIMVCVDCSAADVVVS